MPARTTARRAGRFGAAALLASVALTMIVGVESSAEPISEPLNNGNAMIAGSACESGLQEVAATLPTDATVEGTFICAYDTITIETDARPDAPSTALLGNVFTGESRQVDITSPDQIESAQEAIGAIPETSAQRSDLPNTCLPRKWNKEGVQRRCPPSSWRCLTVLRPIHQPQRCPGRAGVVGLVELHRPPEPHQPVQPGSQSPEDVNITALGRRRTRLGRQGNRRPGYPIRTSPVAVSTSPHGWGETKPHSNISFLKAPIPTMQRKPPPRSTTSRQEIRS